MVELDEGLWGSDFQVPEKEKKEKVKKVIEKATKPKDVKVETVKAIKKAALTLDERLKLITDEVYRVLGKQVENTVCLRSKEALHDYISKCIENGRIAIDTETNNSLDPVTCKIMGLCLYTPGEKQAYVPVNHRNKDTKELLGDQVSESEIKEELERIVAANTYVVMHNGKFDYAVLKCTCNFICPMHWDTMIGAKLLDENKFDRGAAGLKSMYVNLIDPEQEKYDIEHLFKDVEYADVDPEVFALYAATDSLLTDKIYLWEKERFDLAENSDILNIATKIEMPAVTVISEMEMAGMEVDLEYGQLLSNKYHKILEGIDAKIADELKTLQPKVDAWKLTPDANAAQKNRSGKDGKSKVEQLEDPINLGSPSQLAILFYDILKAPVVNTEKPRSTGEEDLKAIAEKLNLDICKLILERREIVKLLSTYIDTIPELAQRWPDHRVRTHFNQYGAATGRLSSSDPINFQNIPSHNKEIRMLFKAKTEEKEVDATDTIIIDKFDEVITPSGWRYANTLEIGDKLLLNDDETDESSIATITNIILIDNQLTLYII